MSAGVFAAKTTAATAALPATPGIGSTLLALAMVLALIVGLAWMVRRLPGFAQRAQTGGSARLRVAASVSLGSKERAVIVAEGDKRWLLGVTAHGITLLDTLASATPSASATASTLAAEVTPPPASMGVSAHDTHSPSPTTIAAAGRVTAGTVPSRSALRTAETFAQALLRVTRRATTP